MKRYYKTRENIWLFWLLVSAPSAIEGDSNEEVALRTLEAIRSSVHGLKSVILKTRKNSQ